MTQISKYEIFKALHQKGNPLVLYNIWDAGGAKCLAEAGAKAIATSSWAVASAHGFVDGEAIPLDLAIAIIERISASVDLPLTVDFEGGYAISPAEVTQNVRRLLHTGTVGLNFEDQVVQGDGIYSIPHQVGRLHAVHKAAALEKTSLFINARTDLFLVSNVDDHHKQMGQAIERGVAYAEAGADCFFVPGLTDLSLIEEIVDAVPLPVNVMMSGALESVGELAMIGVARVSYGPTPYRNAMSDLSAHYEAALRRP